MRSVQGRGSEVRILMVVLAVVLGAGLGAPRRALAEASLLNVSYDPTRELYREFNEAFAKHWLERTGETIRIQQSHGGSGSQSRAVIDGLDADVVTLGLAADIDVIAEKTDRIPADWQKRFPHNSSPYRSTMIFLVRKGNPKQIRDWGDLARDDVSVITPNPKTSGVARWNYLALWGFALRRALGADFVAALADPARAAEVAAAQREAEAFVRRVYANVPVLDAAARAATNTFVQRQLGDVLINWENEVLLSSREFDAAGLDVVVPPVSILAEPVVAVVEANAKRKGNLERAKAYLDYLYSPVGQQIAGKNYYRPLDPGAAAQFAAQFPQLELFTVDEVFGGWAAANAAHFADGASFDRIYLPVAAQ